MEHDIENKLSPQLAYRLANEIEQSFLAEVSNANLTLDEGDVGGTAGNPITLSTYNVEKVFAYASSRLSVGDVEKDKMWYAVVDPFTVGEMTIRGVAVREALGDKAFINGYTGMDFGGFRVYQSNNLPSSVTFTLSTAIPAAADTTTINGVTFTWQTTLGTTAGNVLSETSVTQSAANLVVAINAGAGAGTKYVEISAANRKKLTNANVAATSTAGVVTITGSGRLITAKSFATAANGVFGEQTISSMFGRHGAVSTVVQMQPNVQVNKAVNNLGWTVIGHTLYGHKTFAEGADRMLNVSIQAE